MTVNTWHSETLKAIASIDECLRRKENQLIKINRTLNGKICEVFPTVLHNRDYDSRLSETVILPVGELYTQMQMSTTL